MSRRGIKVMDRLLIEQHMSEIGEVTSKRILHDVRLVIKLLKLYIKARYNEKCNGVWVRPKSFNDWIERMFKIELSWFHRSHISKFLEQLGKILKQLYGDGKVEMKYRNKAGKGQYLHRLWLSKEIVEAILNRDILELLYKKGVI